MDIDLPTLDPGTLQRLLSSDVEAALTTIAGRVRGAAAELLVVTAAVRGCADLTWEGAAASRFEEEVGERVLALGDLEAEATRLAGALDALAGTVGDRLRLVDAARTPVGLVP